MDNRPIGLLDSGLGGLSVAKKVIETKTGHFNTFWKTIAKRIVANGIAKNISKFIIYSLLYKIIL